MFTGLVQEQGQIPYTTPAALTSAAQKFHSAITENGSIPLFYLTFARQYDLAQQDKANKAQHDSDQKIALAQMPRRCSQVLLKLCSLARHLALNRHAWNRHAWRPSRDSGALPPRFA